MIGHRSLIASALHMSLKLNSSPVAQAVVSTYFNMALFLQSISNQIQSLDDLENRVKKAG